MCTRVHRSMIHVAVAEAAVLLTASLGYANILNTSASVRPDNSLIVDVQVTTDSSPAHVVVTYQASGVDPLVSRVTQGAVNDLIFAHEDDRGSQRILSAAFSRRVRTK